MKAKDEVMILLVIAILNFSLLIRLVAKDWKIALSVWALCALDKVIADRLKRLKHKKIIEQFDTNS